MQVFSLTTIHGEEQDTALYLNYAAAVEGAAREFLTEENGEYGERFDRVMKLLGTDPEGAASLLDKMMIEDSDIEGEYFIREHNHPWVFGPDGTATTVKHQLTSRELATVLHGLRIIQEQHDGPGDCTAALCDHYEGAEPLTNPEIDVLCEVLNCVEAADPRQPMQCPFCKEGTLSVCTDAYTYRPLFEIITKTIPGVNPNQPPYQYHDAVLGEIEDTNEYDDYGIFCSNCDVPGEMGNGGAREHDIMEKVAQNEAQAPDAAATSI